MIILCLCSNMTNCHVMRRTTSPEHSFTAEHGSWSHTSLSGINHPWYGYGHDFGGDRGLAHACHMRKVLEHNKVLVVELVEERGMEEKYEGRGIA